MVRKITAGGTAAHVQYTEVMLIPDEAGPAVTVAATLTVQPFGEMYLVVDEGGDEEPVYESAGPVTCPDGMTHLIRQLTADGYSNAYLCAAVMAAAGVFMAATVDRAPLVDTGRTQ